ncbi:YaaA family protein [Longispora albida]|uniref:YaaA family protein n=1 Tax=Longispora albida TaxID=203523 RepID=UPI0003765960|nr:peroxide stress protein YaaA [Longispora albida]
MRILLPPSETKAPGGSGEPLGPLSFPELAPVRQRLVEALTALPPEEARAALGLSDKQDQELKHNLVLRSAATTPAIDRYTGVLYDALEAATLPVEARGCLLVGSALFGLLGAEDMIPPYRLSGGSRLPGVGGLAPLWKPVLGPVLRALPGLVIDMRSGAYSALAPLPGAVTVRVVTAEGKVVSHFNKATKGRLARVLALEPAEDLAGVLAVAEAAGFTARQTGPAALEVVHT